MCKKLNTLYNFMKLERRAIFYSKIHRAFIPGRELKQVNRLNEYKLLCVYRHFVNKGKHGFA